MEEWKYNDFKQYIETVKGNSSNPNDIWSIITHEITIKKDLISSENLDDLFYNTVKDDLLSSTDLSKFFMIVHMYGTPWRRFGRNYDSLFSKLDLPIIDIFACSLYRDLPEVLQVYRVIHDVDEVDLVNLGYCWSLDKNIAIKTFSGNNGFIITGQCLKKDVLACFNYRDEKEVVIIPKNVDLQLISHYSGENL